MRGFTVFPSNWEVKPLATIAKKFIDGDWIESKDQSHTGIRLIQTRNIGQGKFNDQTDKFRFIDDTTFERLNCSEIFPGNILISRLPDPVGRACIVPHKSQRMITAVDCSVVELDGNVIENKFFIYYAQTDAYFRDVEAECTGTTRKRISRRNLGGIKIPIPSQEEQKRIVTILDQAFAALDRARALAEVNLADAFTVFHASVETLLSTHKETWIRGTFEQLVGQVFTGPFGSLLHKNDYVQGGTPLVNPSNIVDGRIVPDASKTVSDAVLKRLYAYQLQSGDIVMGRRGEMGRCAAVPPAMEGWLCGTGSFVIRPKEGVSAELVGYLLRRPDMIERLTGIATGTTMLNLNNRALAEMDFELPAPALQRNLLNSIKGLEEASRRLTDVYAQKLSEIDALQKAVLRQAFSGQLS